MNRIELNKRVRAYTRDFQSSAFRQEDIYDYMNEAINRISFYIYELRGMLPLVLSTDEPILLPKTHHYLISLYAAARLFEQDERAMQATTSMNEFEVKLDELRNAIQNGEVIITDPDGNAVEGNVQNDYVRNVYFNPTYRDSDIPEEE